MRKLGVSVLVLFALVFTCWAVFGVRGFDQNQPFGNGTDEADLDPAVPPRSDRSSISLTPSSATETSVPSDQDSQGGRFGAATDELAETTESFKLQYGHLFGEDFWAETANAQWSPTMAATLDNTIRSVGALIRDVHVSCRATQCGVVVLYQPALFSLDEAVAEQAKLSVFDGIITSIRPVVEASPIAGNISGLSLAQLTREWPDGTNLDESLGTVIHVKWSEPR